MRSIYFDCISGISGDMTVGALIDLGVKPSTLEWELAKLHIGDFHMHFDRAKRKEIEGVKFSIHEGAVHTPEQDEDGHHHHHGHEHEKEHEKEHESEHDHQEKEHRRQHDEEEGEPDKHGHEHEHGAQGHSHSHEHAHEHEHHHGHEHEHGHGCCDHDHDHGHEHDHEHHVHGRTHRQIRELIQASDLSPFVKQHALSIFQRIAVAEGKIHGVSPEEVHFHEVGALDSIADIVLTCIGIEALGVQKIHASALNDGHGTVECAHGTFPVPAPATLEILRGIPLGQLDEPHELITPTGAAIVAEFALSFGPMPTMKIDRIGYGLGSRELASRPNVLRAVLGDLTEA